MRLYTAATSLLCLVLLPFTASALGLGDITLNSALNEPFSAEIPLESAQASELDELTVELASADTFDRYGLDRPAFLSDFRFAVVENENGPVLYLSSAAPVAEPFVTMLLDVRWSSGRLLREYTVLLDPPLFEANVVQPAATPAETAVVSSSSAQGQVDRDTAPDAEVVEATGLFQLQPDVEAEIPSSPVIVAEPDEVSTDVTALEIEADPEPVVEVEVQPAPAPAPAPQAAPANVAPVRNTPYQGMGTSAAAQDNYTTQRGDTLWRISENVRDSLGLSNNQMMLALYRANPDAFMGNINRLKAGAILRIPVVDELEAPSVAEANSEVIEQNAAWTGSGSQESRLQLVAPAEQDDSAGLAATDVSADSGAAAEAEETEASASEAALAEQAAESARLLQIEDAEMQALQERVDAQEEAVLDAEDSGEQVFADEVPQETDQTAAEAIDGAQDAAPGSVGAATAEKSSFLGGIFGSFWFWGAVIVVLLVAVALARARKSEPDDDDVAASTGSWATDIVEPEQNETVKDFGDLGGATDSMVVEEEDFDADDGPAIFADDPDATHADFSVVDREELPVSVDSPVDDSLAGSFEKPAEDVPGDDLDFRVDPDDIFAAPDMQDDSAIQQESAGQDEVELPLEKTISTGAPLNLDQADPIAEAEFHMAYGLYDQAADLLVRALEGAPDNRLYRVKLIEVFFVWENKDGFLEQAQALRGSITDATDSDWNKVLILGKQLCPDDELFSGADAAAPSAGAMDLELSDVGETEVDFTLGGNEVQALDLDLGSDGDSDDGLDLDFGGDIVSEDDDLTLNLGDVDSDSETTMESPTVESFGGDLGFGDADSDSDPTMESPTMESPTAESFGADLDFSDADSDGDSTMESPTIENPLMGGDPELADNDATMESDTIASSLEGATLESPTLDALGSSAETAEMPGLEDPTSLEIDLTGLTDLPLDNDELSDIEDINDSDVFGAALEEPATDGQEDASGPVFGDDDSRMAPETENIRVGDAFEELGKVAGDTDPDTGEVESGDTIEQPTVDAAAGDTAEQPVLDEHANTGVAEESQQALSGEDEAWSLPEDATMTEVGTKLDLARAYIDMGDPDGARSILNEVLDEGENSQQQEARQLLAELDD